MDDAHKIAVGLTEAIMKVRVGSCELQIDGETFALVTEDDLYWFREELAEAVGLTVRAILENRNDK